LIQQGVAVNAVRRDGCTALHCACLEGSGDSAAMIELLLANGADVHKCDSSGRTALDTAANYGSVQCMTALIAAGADVNHTDSTGKYSLHTAADTQHAAAVQLLLQHGATAVMNTIIPIQRLDPNHEVISNGMTALMMCTTTDTLKVLLAAGADVHVSNELGDTCLHAAARCMPALTAPVVCVLIKAGADLHAVNNEGLTAAQLAHDAGNTLIEQLLNRAAEQQQQ
jgi:ankyrin repeat protein